MIHKSSLVILDPLVFRHFVQINRLTDECTELKKMGTENFPWRLPSAWVMKSPQWCDLTTEEW